jgi:malate dehydrogenase (oxaloacetate-decarboxylating)(NADP+)
MVTEAELDTGLIYPPQTGIFKTELHAARRVAEVIFRRGLAGVTQPPDFDTFIQSRLYRPEYLSLI